jgi:excisionase family DNA binding protein
MKDHPASDYITPGEAADKLGISRTTLGRMVERGDIKPLTLPSGHRRYLRSDIEKLTGWEAS